MTTVSTDHSMRSVQYRAFDDLTKEIQDDLNYFNMRFSSQDIVYLHGLYINRKKTVNEIVRMIDEKDAWATVTNQLVKSNG